MRTVFPPPALKVKTMFIKEGWDCKRIFCPLATSCIYMSKGTVLFKGIPLWRGHICKYICKGTCTQYILQSWLFTHMTQEMLLDVDDGEAFQLLVSYEVVEVGRQHAEAVAVLAWQLTYFKYLITRWLFFLSSIFISFANKYYRWIHGVRSSKITD